MNLLFPAERLNERQLGKRRIIQRSPHRSYQTIQGSLCTQQKTTRSLQALYFTMLPHNYDVCTVVPNRI